MKRICKLIAAFLLISSTVYGQQTPAGPTPANVSTAPPRRYSAEEMSRFRSMRAASQPGVELTLGDQQSSSRAVNPSVQPASYLSQRNEKPPVAAGVGASPPAPVSAQPQVPSDDIPVPAILSGKSPTPKTSTEQANSFPSEVKLNQGPPATNPESNSGPLSALSQPSPSRPEMKTFGSTPLGNTKATHPAARSAQTPIDLRAPAQAVNRAIPTQQDSSEVMKTGVQEDASASPQDRVASALHETASPLAADLPKLRNLSATPVSAAANLPLPRAVQSLSRSPSLADQATMHSEGAEISVSTTGPKSISIGKNANYGVVVTNSGNSAAQQIEIEFAVPLWIDVANANVTDGGKELVKEADATRVHWRIDRLESGNTQQLTLEVIPRKAQAFDLNVQWSIAPLAGTVQVQVTEPLLKMEIAGPDEVQFGQSASYNVTIRNPGTGLAENVVLMLSEALGGEQAPIGNLEPGEERNIEVELIARDAGELELGAAVSGDSDLQDSVTKQIVVRRAQLEIAIQGPAKKYAGAVANYVVTVQNTGDAPAEDVSAAIGIPAGAQYLSGIDGAENIEGGMRWSVGALPPGAQRTYTVACQMNAAGPIQLETGVRGAGDLADASSIQTLVETEADLVLTVNDPQGPLPVGQDVTYQITVKNRGTKAAKGIDVVMHFSNGIEPTSAEGRKHSIQPGEVSFDSIEQINPGEETAFQITAKATIAGTHEFRAQLMCAENDAREVAGGTTKFFGEDE